MHFDPERSFALWRLPRERQIFHLAGTPTAFDSVEALLASRERRFVFAPFAITKDCPPIALVGKIETVEPKIVPADFEIEALGQNREDYFGQFAKFMQALKDGKFSKIVLSRRECFFATDSVDPLQIFQKALETYENAFVYLFHTPQTGTWLGCSPEILLSSQGAWRTVALAGTREQGGAWDLKNRREQALVADFVRERLCEAGLQICEEKTETVLAGTLEHLKTEFFLNPPSFEQAARAVKILHPTPAVAGTPRDEALKFILEHETFPRKYYAGFVGEWGADVARLFVNLRCMRLEGKTLEFYAGGGLLPDSLPEAEWRETAIKMETLGRLFRCYGPRHNL
ncbi:MAG: chorismate-binding protein [Opitutales bacterium]|nr:chorismate-binding protein [Opitutales bacterium]